MTGHETMAKYFGRLLALVNDMRAHDENVEANKMVEKVLQTLTSK